MDERAGIHVRYRRRQDNGTLETPTEVADGGAGDAPGVQGVGAPGALRVGAPEPPSAVGSTVAAVRAIAPLWIEAPMGICQDRKALVRHPEEEVTMLVGRGQATGEYGLSPMLGRPAYHMLQVCGVRVSVEWALC
jgi:hypothetical protein